MIKESLQFFKDKILYPSFTDDKHRQICSIIFDRHWDKFIQLPASRTGHHHSVIENLVPFGLINHTNRVVYFTDLLCKEENVDNRNDYITAAWLHDIGKILVKTKEDYHIHGKLGADLVATDIYDLENGIMIYLMINNHMAHWHGIKFMGIPDRIVAYADLLASQPRIEIKDIQYLTNDMFTNKDETFEKWN